MLSFASNISCWGICIEEFNLVQFSCAFLDVYLGLNFQPFSSWHIPVSYSYITVLPGNNISFILLHAAPQQYLCAVNFEAKYSQTGVLETSWSRKKSHSSLLYVRNLGVKCVTQFPFQLKEWILSGLRVREKALNFFKRPLRSSFK